MESHRLDSRRKFLTIVRNDDLSIRALYDPNFTNPEIELSHGIGLNRSLKDERLRKEGYVKILGNIGERV